MNTCYLKDKIAVTKEFLNELETKSWQEIEHLQNQIANIEDTQENLQLIQLLKNLLTSYYVFTGGLENFTDIKAVYKIPEFTNNVYAEKELPTVKSEIKTDLYDDDMLEVSSTNSPESPKIEPFEYFIDFDEPSGDPISDEDLYGN